MDYSIPKYHIYQVWNSTGQYLGVLQNVSSEFKLIQDLNTLGPSSITIKVAQSGDTAKLPVKAITTEDGKLMLTEDGKVITTEGEPTNFGVMNSKIKNGNIIKITEYSNYYPNGLLVFTGKIKKWGVKFGTSDDMTLTVYPLSTDLNDHIFKVGEILSSSQTSYDSTFTVYGGPDNYDPNSILNYTTNSRLLYYKLPASLGGATNISKVVIRAAANNGAVPVKIKLQVSDATVDPSYALGTTFTTITSTTPADVTLTFATPISLVAGHRIAFTITSTAATSGNGATIHYTNSNTYGDSQLYFGGVDNDIIQSLPQSDGELYFSMYSIPPYTKITLTNFEPSSALKTALNNYIGEGGSVTYDDTTVITTGITIPAYTFSVNTVHDAVKIVLDYSPQGFYFTVDPGTNILTFKQISSTPDHLIIFKRHIQELDLSASIESLKNAVYMTGGEVAGVNVFRYNQDLSSINEFGIGLDRITDSRVVSNSTADSRIINHIDKNNDEEFESYVTVVDGMEDITKYKPGHTVGIRGTGIDLVDLLVLPIVRVERLFGYAKLYLGILPIRESNIINDSQEQILALQTVANPNQPS